MAFSKFPEGRKRQEDLEQKNLEQSRLKLLEQIRQSEVKIADKNSKTWETKVAQLALLRLQSEYIKKFGELPAEKQEKVEDVIDIKPTTNAIDKPTAAESNVELPAPRTTGSIKLEESMMKTDQLTTDKQEEIPEKKEEQEPNADQITTMEQIEQQETAETLPTKEKLQKSPQDVLTTFREQYDRLSYQARSQEAALLSRLITDDPEKIAQLINNKNSLLGDGQFKKKISHILELQQQAKNADKTQKSEEEREKIGQKKVEATIELIKTGISIDMEKLQTADVPQKFVARFKELTSTIDALTAVQELIKNNIGKVLELDIPKLGGASWEGLKNFICSGAIAEREKLETMLNSLFIEQTDIIRQNYPGDANAEKRMELLKEKQIQYLPRKKEIRDKFYQASLDAIESAVKQVLEEVKDYLPELKEKLGIDGLLKLAENQIPSNLGYDFRLRAEETTEDMDLEIEPGETKAWFNELPRDAQTFRQLDKERKIVCENDFTEDKLNDIIAAAKDAGNYILTQAESGYKVSDEWRQAAPFNYIEYSREPVSEAEQAQGKTGKVKIEKISFPCEQAKAHFFIQLEGRKESEDENKREKERKEMERRLRAARGEVIAHLTGSDSLENELKINGELKELETKLKEAKQVTPDDYQLKGQTAQEKLKEMIDIFGRSRGWNCEHLGGEEFMQKFIAGHNYCYFNQDILEKNGLCLSLEDRMLFKTLIDFLSTKENQNIKLTLEQKRNLILHFAKNNNLAEYSIGKQLPDDVKSQIAEQLRQKREDLVDLGLLKKEFSTRGVQYVPTFIPDRVFIPNKDIVVDDNIKVMIDDKGDIKYEFCGMRYRLIPEELEYTDENGKQAIQKTHGDLGPFDERYRSDRQDLWRELKYENSPTATMHVAYLLKKVKWPQKLWEKYWPEEEYNPNEERSLAYQKKIVIIEGEFKGALAADMKMTGIDHLSIYGITSITEEHIKLTAEAGVKEIIFAFDVDLLRKALERGDAMSDATKASFVHAMSLIEYADKSGLKFNVNIGVWPQEFYDGLYSGFGKDVEDFLIKLQGKKGQRTTKTGLEIYQTEVIEKALTPDEFKARVNKKAQENNWNIEALNSQVERLKILHSKVRKLRREHQIARDRGAQGLSDPSAQEKIEIALLNLEQILFLLRNQASLEVLGVRNLDQPQGEDNILSGPNPKKQETIMISKHGPAHPAESAEANIRVINILPQNAPPYLNIKGELSLFEPSNPNNLFIKPTKAEFSEFGKDKNKEAVFVESAREFFKSLTKEEKKILASSAKKRGLFLDSKGLLANIAAYGFAETVSQEPTYNTLTLEQQREFQQKTERYLLKADIEAGWQIVSDTKEKPTAQEIATKMSWQKRAAFYIIANKLSKQFDFKKEAYIVLDEAIYQGYDGQIIEQARFPIAVYSKKTDTLKAIFYFTLDAVGENQQGLAIADKLNAQIAIMQEIKDGLQAQSDNLPEQTELKTSLEQAGNNLWEKQKELYQNTEKFIELFQKDELERDKLKTALRGSDYEDMKKYRSGIEQFIKLAQDPQYNQPDKLEQILSKFGFDASLMPRLLSDIDIVYLSPKNFNDLLALANSEDAEQKAKWEHKIGAAAFAGFFDTEQGTKKKKVRFDGDVVIFAQKGDYSKASEYVKAWVLPLSEKEIKNNSAFALDRPKMSALPAIVPLRGLSSEPERPFMFLQPDLSRLKTSEAQDKQVIIALNEIGALKQKASVLENNKTDSTAVIGLDSFFNQLDKENLDKIINTGAKEIIIAIDNLEQTTSALDDLPGGLNIKGACKEIYFLAQKIKERAKKNGFKEINVKIQIAGQKPQTVAEYFENEKYDLTDAETLKKLKSEQKFLELYPQLLTLLNMPFNPAKMTQKMQETVNKTFTDADSADAVKTFIEKFGKTILSNLSLPHSKPDLNFTGAELLSLKMLAKDFALLSPAIRQKPGLAKKV